MIVVVESASLRHILLTMKNILKTISSFVIISVGYLVLTPFAHAEMVTIITEDVDVPEITADELEAFKGKWKLVNGDTFLVIKSVSQVPGKSNVNVLDKDVESLQKAKVSQVAGTVPMLRLTLENVDDPKGIYNLVRQGDLLVGSYNIHTTKESTKVSFKRVKEVPVSAK